MNFSDSEIFLKEAVGIHLGDACQQYLPIPEVKSAPQPDV